MKIMNREAFKLARDTLRTAVRKYGWRLTWGKHRPEHIPKTARNRYSSGPGKFEGEHWSIVHWYQAMLDGMGDEPFYDGDDVAADVFEVSDVERAAFMLDESDQFAVLWHSGQGFESLEYINAARYDRLRAQSDNEVSP